VFGLASLLAQIATAAACSRRARRTERHRRPWIVLGAITAGLVVVRALATYNGKAVPLPVACVFSLLCWLTWRDPLAARTVVWAGLLLMGASLLLHEVGLAADASTARESTWAYQMTGIVKHGAELAGWLLVATGLVAGIQGRQVSAVPAVRSSPQKKTSVAG
jgi:hypothetical protein